MKYRIVFLLCCLIYGGSGYCSDLIISELFIDGTDERIEITNISNQDFLGTISLVGVKSKQLEIKDVFLGGRKSLIFGDKDIQFLEKIIVGKTGLGFSLGDKKSIYITLTSSEGDTDTFIVEESIVIAYDNKKTSFEKTCNESICTFIQATPSEKNKNMISGYTGTPGYFSYIGNTSAVLEEQQGASGDIIDDTKNQENQTISSGSSIVSTGAAFSGAVIGTGMVVTGTDQVIMTGGTIYTGYVITGENTIIISVIPGSESVVSGSNNDTTNTEEQKENVHIPSSPPTQQEQLTPIIPICPLFIKESIYGSGGTIARIIFTGNVDHCDDSRFTHHWTHKESSIVGKCEQSFLFPFGSTSVLGEIMYKDEVLCRNTLFFFSQEPIKEEQHIVCSEKERILGDLFVSEIHPKDTNDFPEYIELGSHTGYSGSVSIRGLGHGGASKDVSLHIGPGRYHIITDKKNVFDGAYTVLSSISLTDSGEEISLYRQGGQDIDKVVYTSSLGGDSAYISSISGDINMFTTNDIPTPGFTRKAIKHVLQEKENQEFSCHIGLQHTEPISYGNKINLIASVKGKEIQNTSKEYICERSFADTSYAFTGCNPGFYDYDYEGIFEVGLTMKDTEGKICTTKTFINYPENKASGGSGGGKSEYYKGLYTKWKGRYDTLKTDIRGLGYSVTTSGNIVTTYNTTDGASFQTQQHTKPVYTTTISGSFWSIEAILPNPQGKDTDREEVIIKNHSDEDQLFSGYYFTNGRSKKYVRNGVVIPKYSTGTIIGTLGLTNKPSCISLGDKQGIYDTFCYAEAGNDQWFTSSLDIHTSISTVGSESNPSPIDVLGSTKLTLTDEQACMYYDGQEVICKSLPYTTSESKQWKKDAKKYTSILKKFTKEEETKEKRRTKYYDTQAKRKRDVEQLKNQLKYIKADTDVYRKEAQLHKNFVRGIIDTLSTDWFAVYVASGIQEKQQIYNELYHVFREGNVVVEYMGQTFAAEDIEKIHDLQSKNILPLDILVVEGLYTEVFTDTQETIATFLDNLKIQHV